MRSALVPFSSASVRKSRASAPASRTSLATRRYDHRAYSAGKMRGSLSKARQSSMARLLTSATASAPHPCSAIVGQLQIALIKSSRELPDLLPRRVKLRDGLQICRALGCLLCRFEPHLRRARGAAGLRQVLREVVGFPVGDLRQLEFDLLGDAGVELSSLPLEERIVRYVPHQSMLEGVDPFVVIALEPYQSGRAQPLESGFKGVVVLARNSRQKSMRKTAPDHRRELSDRLGIAEPLETEHQGVVERRWHFGGPTVDDPSSGARINLAGLEGRRRQLFYEQWHAVRSRHDLLDQLARQRLVADDGAREIAALVVVHALQQDAPEHQRNAADCSRPAGDHEQNRRGADLAGGTLDDLDRRWDGAVEKL